MEEGEVLHDGLAGVLKIYLKQKLMEETFKELPPHKCLTEYSTLSVSVEENKIPQ